MDDLYSSKRHLLPLFLNDTRPLPPLCEGTVIRRDETQKNPARHS
jgi:hypothetical protein